MKILLACGAGMSTTLLEKSVRDYAKEHKLDIECDAMATNEAKGKIDQYHVVLLGPQVGYELKSFKSIAGKVPVAIIPGATYAMAKAKETIDLANELLKSK